MACHHPNQEHVLIAEIVQLLTSNLLSALMPPVAPNVFLLSVTPRNGKGHAKSVPNHDISFFELSSEVKTVSYTLPQTVLADFDFETTPHFDPEHGSNLVEEKITRLFEQFYSDVHHFHDRTHEIYLKKIRLLGTINYLSIVIPVNDEHSVNSLFFGAILDVISEEFSQRSALPIDGKDYGQLHLRAQRFFSSKHFIHEITRKGLIRILGSLSCNYFHPDFNSFYDMYLAGMELFSLFHTISTTLQEGEPCQGFFLLLNREDAVPSIPFLEIDNDMALIRKLLPLSSQENYLLCDHKGPFGLGKKNACQNIIFEVQFTDFGSWRVLHDDKVLARVRNNNIVSWHEIENRNIRSQFQRTFGDEIGDCQIQTVLDMVARILSIKHKGTTLVFCADSKNESKRLASRGCRTHVNFSDGFKLPLLENMIAIDGAMLFDLELRCHGIGMILDGQVTKEPHGDRKRGARYNSAYTYIKSLSMPTIAIVISEDGVVDVLSSFVHTQ